MNQKFSLAEISFDDFAYCWASLGKPQTHPRRDKRYFEIVDAPSYRDVQGLVQNTYYGIEPRCVWFADGDLSVQEARMQTLRSRYDYYDTLQSRASQASKLVLEFLDLPNDCQIPVCEFPMYTDTFEFRKTGSGLWTLVYLDNHTYHPQLYCFEGVNQRKPLFPISGITAEPALIRPNRSRNR